MGLKLNGATSGSIEIDVPAVAGTDTAITIPATTGGEFIVSDSNGNIDLGPLDINGGASDNSVNIDGSGRLLVGTTSTTLNHPIQAVATSDANAIAIIGRASDDIGELSFYENDQTTILGELQYRQDHLNFRHRVGDIRFATAGVTERMRINSQGFALHSNTGAYDNATGNYHQFRSNQTNWTIVAANYQTTEPYGVLIDFDVDQNDTGSPFLYCQGGSSLRMQVRSNGGIANFQSNNVNLCDEREKKNIESLDSTWGCLKNWDLKKFHYNEDADTDDKRYGVIAQQVAPHCPEVITDWVKQKAADAVLDEEGNEVEPAREEIVRMGVKEQQMMWMAIKALQEAQIRIETLETDNASQAATIAALDARLTALEGGAS